MKITGGCLCGDITFEISPPFSAFTHCYCSRCRKATGSGRASVLIASPGQLGWTKGGDKARRWDLPSASSFATSFCPRCGSPLPRLTRSGAHAVIPAGSLDDPLPVKPDRHEHWTSRANWVCVDERDLIFHDGDAP